MEIVIISFVMLFLIITNVCVVSYLIYSHKPIKLETKPIMFEPTLVRKPSRGRRAPIAHDEEVLWQKEQSEKKAREPMI